MSLSTPDLDLRGNIFEISPLTTLVISNGSQTSILIGRDKRTDFPILPPRAFALSLNS